MSYYHFKKLHCRVAEIVHHRATAGDCTHLLLRSRWKPTAGGIMVLVFLCVLLVLFGELCTQLFCMCAACVICCIVQHEVTVG
jgi:hypothetical protein